MKFAALALLGTASAQYNLLYSNDYDWVGDCYETLSASVCNQDYNVQTDLDGGIASWDYTYEVTLTVHNHATNSLSLWWVDYDGYQQWYADIAPVSPTIRVPSTLTHGCSTLATTTDTAPIRPSPSATPPTMSPPSSETRPTETCKSSSETQTRCGLNLNHLFLQILDDSTNFNK